MSNQAFTVRIEARDEKLRHELESILMADGSFRIEPGSPAAFDLLVYEVAGEIAAMTEIAAITEIARHSRTAEVPGEGNPDAMRPGSAREVFIVSRQTSPEFLLALMRAGFKEFIPVPLKREDVVGAIQRYKERSGRPSGARKHGMLIHVIGAKGGVGTTTVAVNLAASLIGLDGIGSVLLADMNPLLGGVSLYLGIAPPVFSWLEVVEDVSRLDAVYLMNLLHKHPSGLHVLCAPPGLIEAPPAAEALASLIGLTRSLFDAVVFDGGNAFGELSRTVLGYADRSVLVCNLDLPCIVNAKKLRAAIVKLLPEDRIEIVANRQQKHSRITLQDAREALSRPVIAVPNDFRTAMSAINQGKTLSNLAPDAPITRSVKALASRLTGKEDKEEKKRLGFFRTVSARIGSARIGPGSNVSGRSEAGRTA